MQNIRRFVNKTVLGGMVACWLLAGGTASADLIYLGTTNEGGTGLGAVTTLLSFQSAANNTTSSAAVVVNDENESEVLEGPNTTIVGGANNQVRTLEEAGISEGSEFRLLWNISEPGSEDPPQVQLLSLSVLFYNPDGDVVHTAEFDTSTCAAFDCMFDQVGAGTGSEGHVFGLNAEQQAELDAQVAIYGVEGIRVGLGASGTLVSLAEEQGGIETFNLAVGEGSVNPPEPASLLLFGVALTGFAARVRRRRRATIQ